jgi:two-component system invasion response regulator UvrY
MKKTNYRKIDQTIRVAIVEDHTVMRQGLVLLLKREPQVVVSFHAENGSDFFQKLKDRVIDIVLLDLDMPVMNGIETLRILRRDFPDIQVIMLSMHQDPLIVAELIKEGAKSFLKKNCSFEELMDALFEVKFRGKHTNELVENALFTSHASPAIYQDNLVRFNLNARDLVILKMICDGKTSDHIANKLNLSKKSIDGIRSELLKKCGAKNPTELLRKSILNGLYIARTDDQIQEEERLEENQKLERKKNRFKVMTQDDTISK